MTKESYQKWRETMKRKHNVDDAGLLELQREWQRKSRQNPNVQKGKHRGGFTVMKENDPEKFKEISRKGGQKSGEKKNKTTTQHR